MKKLLLRLDDASEYMDVDKWRNMERILDKYNVKPLFGIIPANNDEKLLKYRLALVLRRAATRVPVLRRAAAPVPALRKHLPVPALVLRRAATPVPVQGTTTLPNRPFLLLPI